MKRFLLTCLAVMLAVGSIWAQKIEKVRVTNKLGTTETYDFISAQKKGIYVWDEKNGQIFIPNQEMKLAVCMGDDQEVVLWSDSLVELRRMEQNPGLIARKKAKAERKVAQVKMDADPEEPQIDVLAEAFGEADNIVWYGDGQRLFMNTERHRLMINGHIYDFKDILNYSVEDDPCIVTEETTTTSKPKNVVGRALVGSMLGGSTGAIIGGSTAKHEMVTTPGRSYTVHDYMIFVTVNELKNPVETIHIGESTFDLHNLCAVFDVIINGNDNSNETGSKELNDTASLSMDIVPDIQLQDTIIEWKGHLAFKGVPLDGPLKAFVGELEKKDMKTVLCEKGGAVLLGNFAGYDDCIVCLGTVPGQDCVAKAVAVLSNFQDWSTLKRNYDDLVLALTSKYGKPWESIEKPGGFDDEWTALLADRCQYETSFVAEGGQVTIMLKYVDEIGHCIVIGYQDGINGVRGFNAAFEDL